MLEIDGSIGEGGGQILRTSLSLSIITGQPIRIVNIRGKRKSPGLKKQHLTALLGAQEISDAKVSGAFLGSQQIEFYPQTITSGDYNFDTQSAGSTALIFQTLYPALIFAKGESSLTIHGGTHNLKAPPFEFITNSFLPLLSQMGIEISYNLERYGYYPKGGGKVTIEIIPLQNPHTLKLTQLSEIKELTAEIVTIRKSKLIADSQENEILKILPQCTVQKIFPPSVGPANSISIHVVRENHTQTFTAFGKRNRDDAIIAKVCAQKVKIFIESNILVDTFLADQLLLPLLLTGGGEFISSKPSLHTTTNMHIIKLFTGKEIIIKEIAEGTYLYRVPALQ